MSEQTTRPGPWGQAPLAGYRDARELELELVAAAREHVHVVIYERRWLGGSARPLPLSGRLAAEYRDAVAVHMAMVDIGAELASVAQARHSALRRLELAFRRIEHTAPGLVALADAVRDVVLTEAERLALACAMAAELDPELAPVLAAMAGDDDAGGAGLPGIPLGALAVAAGLDRAGTPDHILPHISIGDARRWQTRALVNDGLLTVADVRRAGQSVPRWRARLASGVRAHLVPLTEPAEPAEPPEPPEPEDANRSSAEAKPPTSDN